MFIILSMRKFSDISAMRKFIVVQLPCNAHFCNAAFYLQCALLGCNTHKVSI